MYSIFYKEYELGLTRAPDTQITNNAIETNLEYIIKYLTGQNILQYVKINGVEQEVTSFGCCGKNWSPK